jgi:hypothetical protein
MLSSRDTPFSADGWALIIEDVRRLALLVGGGANDLNAGAVDANQEALNDLASALNEHEVDQDAHAELLSNYLLRTEATGSFAPTYLTTASGSAKTLANGVAGQITTQFGTASGTLSGSFSSGVFTAPGAGLYQFSFIAEHLLQVSAAAAWNYIPLVTVSSSAQVFSSRLDGTVSAANIYRYWSCTSGAEQLSSGDTITFQSTIGSTNFTSAFVTPYALSIIRLSES